MVPMNSRIIKIISAVSAVAMFAGFIWGAQAYLYSTYATASDLKRLENRFDVKILHDRLSNVQERIWKIEDRYENKKMGTDAKEQYRLLIDEKGQIEKELESLKKSE